MNIPSNVGSQPTHYLPHLRNRVDAWTFSSTYGGCAPWFVPPNVTYPISPTFAPHPLLPRCVSILLPLQLSLGEDIQPPLSLAETINMFINSVVRSQHGFSIFSLTSFFFLASNSFDLNNTSLTWPNPYLVIIHIVLLIKAWEWLHDMKNPTSKPPNKQPL